MPAIPLTRDERNILAVLPRFETRIPASGTSPDTWGYVLAVGALVGRRVVRDARTAEVALSGLVRRGVLREIPPAAGERRRWFDLTPDGIDAWAVLAR